MKTHAILLVVAIALSTAPTVHADPDSTIPGNGTFLVGTDVAPAQCFSPGGIDGNLCIWERLSSLANQDDFSNIIDSGMSIGQQYANIQPSDTAFKTTNCQTWVQR